jgi:hypothetical protein
VGLTRFELVTPRLSSVCSNQLSYRPLGLTQAPTLSVKEPDFAKASSGKPNHDLPTEAQSAKAGSFKTR